MRVAAFLPAKGTSSRISNKNVALMDGEPLFLRSLKKLMQMQEIDEVFLDSDSADIHQIAAGISCHRIQRAPELASNSTDGNQLLLNQISHTEAEICVQLLCTSPFIEPGTIARAIQVLKEDPSFDSVVAVRKEKQYLWENGRTAYDLNRIPNSFDLPDRVIESMGLYVIRRETALRTGRRIGDNPYLLELSPTEGIDVNYPQDFVLANTVAAGLREHERRLLQSLKRVLSSPLLSDILDDLGVETCLSRTFAANYSAARIFGRAKTLRIEPCQNAAEAQGIYKALSLYDHVVSDDVLVVSSAVPEFAFFGELNASLAIRSGAVGAIIDGCTRDQEATRRLGFPVYAKGTTCRDVRGRATMAHKNLPVTVDGITIANEDLIFADPDGIVVIPRKLETVVLTEAMKNVRRETALITAIAEGKEAAQLFDTFGAF